MSLFTEGLDLEYVLLTRHRPLADLLALYQQKFGVHYISPVLYGLAYFDDAENELDPLLLWKLNWRTVKKGIQQRVRELAR